MKNNAVKLVSIIAVFALSAWQCAVYPSAVNQASEKTEIADRDSTERYYWELFEEYENSGYSDYTGAPIDIPFSDGLKAKEIDGRNAAVWENDTESVACRISVPQSALYSLEIDYYAVNDKPTDIQRGMLVDGELLCREWNNLIFTRLFEDYGEIRTDVNGDQSAPDMKQIYRWQTTGISDYNGYFSSPMKLYLSAGQHVLTFTMRGNQPIAIGGLRLIAPEKLKSYSEVASEYEEKGYKPSDESLEIEAENTLYRSSASLRLESSDDLSCSPSDVSKSLINTIGGDSWKKSRQTITWRIDVPKDGLYKIALHMYSYYNYGIPAYRRIEIDGAVPFGELAEYKFLPNTDWRTEQLAGSDGEPYQFYLTKGTHTFSMSAVTGEMTGIIRVLTEDMDVLSDLYRKITMVTTSDPDTNYDYQLDKRVPDLMETMRQLYNNLDSCCEAVKNACGSDKALTYSEIKNIMEDLEILMDDVFEIPSNISQFTSMLSKYGNWTTQLKAGTMEIDRIILAPKDKDVTVSKASFIKRMISAAASFFSTFVKDYSAVIGDGEYNENSTVIDVWFGGTQIWASEIQDLIDSRFVKDTGIQVRFKLTPASQMSTGINAMLLSILSGTAPDAVLNAASISDYAMRNQCYDLTQFDDYKEIEKRFHSTCIVPLTYKGKVFGLPQTMDMSMMFYRTDIFGELGLEAPDTWDEMISKVIPKLAENSMTLAQSPGFEVLLFQNGGEYYNEDMTESLVAGQKAWEAFKLHCNFYTMYGVPKTADFFNRFRTGETPVGFGKFGDYIKFIYAAPELAGRWKAALMPGTVQEDGKINRNIGGLLSGAAMIMADAKHPNEAWQFLKWFTSTDIQIEISERMEAKLDMSARLISANIEAFESLDWDKDDLKVFEELMKETKAYNPVLGNYYTSRYLGYAYNYVVVSKTMSEREALEYAQKNINNELSRRRNGLS